MVALLILAINFIFLFFYLSRSLFHHTRDQLSCTFITITFNDYLFLPYPLGPLLMAMYKLNRALVMIYRDCLEGVC